MQRQFYWKRAFSQRQSVQDSGSLAIEGVEVVVWPILFRSPSAW